MSGDILGYPELSRHILCYRMSRVILGYTFTQQYIPGDHQDIPGYPRIYTSGTLRYMISYMIYNNYDIAYDIICLVMSMIS